VRLFRKVEKERKSEMLKEITKLIESGESGTLEFKNSRTHAF